MGLDVEERKALTKAVSTCIQRYVKQELAPLLNRIESLENHSESIANRADDLTRRTQQLDAKIAAAQINARNLQ